MLVVLDYLFALVFDGAHLLRVVVVVRECPVNVGHVNVVTVSDRPRFETTVFDLRLDELNSNPPAFEVWLVV